MSKKKVDKVYKKVQTSVGMEYWIKKELKANKTNISKLVNNLLKQYLTGKKGD